jgi:urease accessory protein
MLSHVARRASKAQGVAMLTLFARGLSRPVGFDDLGDNSSDKAEEIIGAYKKLVRKGAVPGHLAICWGVITASLGLASGKLSAQKYSSYTD